MAQPREMITRLRLPPLLNSDTHERFSLERHEADATNLLCEQPSIHIPISFFVMPIWSLLHAMDLDAGAFPAPSLQPSWHSSFASWSSHLTGSQNI